MDIWTILLYAKSQMSFILFIEHNQNQIKYGYYWVVDVDKPLWSNKPYFVLTTKPLTRTQAILA